MQLPPPLLKSVQAWFGSVLRTPLEPGNHINKKHIKKATEFIPAAPGMQAHERIEIYNQQYWWRLYGAVQEVLPGTTRLLGRRLFNQQIALPYLIENNPSSWSLYKLSKKLHPWIENNLAPGLPRSMALLDLTFYSTFLSEVIPFDSLNPSARFKLQPHVRLLSLSEDLIACRKILLNHPLQADSITIQAPSLRSFYAVLFRKPCTGLTFWEEIRSQEWALLKAFEKGCTLEEAFEGLSEDWDIKATFEFFTNAKLLRNE